MLKAYALYECKNRANACESFPRGFSVFNHFQLKDILNKIEFLCICRREWIFFCETYLALGFSQVSSATMYCGKGCAHQLPAPWGIAPLLGTWRQREWWVPTIRDFTHHLSISFPVLILVSIWPAATLECWMPKCATGENIKLSLVYKGDIVE